MFSPRQSLRRAGNSSKPLPRLDELADLYAQGFDPREGEFWLFGGYSKSGKSALTLWMVDSWDVTALYFSADTSRRDQIVRLCAKRTGDTTDIVSEAMRSGNDQKYWDILGNPKIVFNWQTQPSMRDVLEELDAYVEVRDEMPKVIVLDNLRNFVDKMEYEEIHIFTADCLELARRTGSTVILLHHAQADKRDPETEPPPKGALEFKVDKLPEGIITMARDGNTLKVANVASRSQSCDASGKTYAQLRADISRCTFSSIQFEYHVPDGVESWWQK